MRELLTGLAIVLIIVLTTILVAPYFVDWNGQRAFLEARLSRALGQPVTIGGHIDLKLLPTPYLVVDQVVVGSDEGPLRVGIHHLDLELAAAPLLHGQFDITEARLVEPQVRLTLQEDRSLPALPQAAAFSADVRFDRIHVADGTLSVTDPSSGRTFLFDHLDFDADAGSLKGPFKVNGRQGPAGARTTFRLATAAPEHGRAHVRLIVDETPTHASYDFDGNADLQSAAGGTLRQRFSGNVVMAGHLRDGDALTVPWRLAGPLKADPAEAVLEGGELRLGGEDAAVTLTADARGDFDAPNMTLALSGKQLDIDRLSGAPVEPTKPPPPPKLPGLTTLRRLLAALHPPMRTALDLSIENALYGGETLSDIQAHLGLGEASQPLRVSADGPGGTHVALDGRLTAGADPSFEGNLKFAVANLPRATEWLASVAPAFPWTPGDLRFKSAKIEGPLRIHDGKVENDATILTLDRSVLKGKTQLAFGDDGKPTRVAAQLAADPLDLDSLPRVAFGGAPWPFDFDLALSAQKMKVARVGDGPLETGPIKLGFLRTGRRIELRELKADDLGGAKIDVRGNAGAQKTTLSASLEAGRLDRFAGLVQQVFPSAFADKFAARATALAPAKIKLDAELTGSPEGGLVPARIAIAGTLSGTKLDAAAKPLKDQARATTLSATADAPEGSVVLSQLGFTTLPGIKVGPTHLALSARGRRGDRVETNLKAGFGETKLDMTGGFDLRAREAAGAGTLHLDSPDVTPLLQSLAITFPDLAERVPLQLEGGIAIGPDGPSLRGMTGRIAGAAATGAFAWHANAAENAPQLTGRLDLDRASLAGLVGLALGAEQAPAPDAAWSAQPFAGGLVEPPRANVALSAKTLDVRPGVTAQNAQMSLAIAPNLMTLDKVKAELAGGTASGGAKLRRDGRQATVEGKLAFEHVAVDLAALGTRLTGTMDFAGSGTTAKGLVSSLAGSGEAAAANLNVTGGDPAVLPKIFDDIESDILAVDEETVVRAFGELAKGALPLGNRKFGISLVGGVVHFKPKEAAQPAKGPVVAKIEASVDLNAWKLDAEIGETLLKLPKDWSGPPPSIVMKLGGPIEKPARSYDVSLFLNALASRALAREAARVEAYEFDLRERAFFNARLQTERRREKERQLAEEQARKAEEDRKTRAEDARKERERKAQEDKDGTKPDADKPDANKTGAEKPDTEKPNTERDQTSRRDDRPEASSRPPRRPGDRKPSGDDIPRPPRRPAPALTDPSTLGRY